MEQVVHPVIEAAEARALVRKADYEALYRESVEDNEGFWAKHAQRIDWMTPFTKVKDASWNRDDLHVRWFEDGTLNVCHNCVDRHLEARGD